VKLFKFTPGATPTLLENGDLMPPALSVTWTERYLDPGEFEIKAKLSSGLKEFLPAGTFISHIDTMEVMVVENHQITEEQGADPDLIITGRSLESWLENRITGSDQARSTSTVSSYQLSSNLTWVQAVAMVNSHIQTPAVAGDGLDNIIAAHSVTGTGTTELRNIDRGTLHSKLLEILKVDDLGIKTIRKNPFTGYGGNNTNTILLVHRGVDRKANVRFSWTGGDIETAEYLFSGKKIKTSAMVVGRWVQTIVDTGSASKYNRRFMLVDADDIDGQHGGLPMGTALTLVLGAMEIRGKQALKAQNKVSITRADISNLPQYT
jgi:Siphovirus ReqiPepy6 Gp37-like protein